MSFVQAIIGGVIALILMVAVAYPVVKDVSTNQSATATGTDKTILDLLPTMVVIGCLVAAVVYFINMK